MSRRVESLQLGSTRQDKSQHEEIGIGLDVRGVEKGREFFSASIIFIWVWLKRVEKGRKHEGCAHGAMYGERVMRK